MFFSGFLLTVFSFAAVVGGALMESPARREPGTLDTILSGSLLVRPARPAPLGGDPKELVRPLTDARTCIDLLRAHPAVAGVLPFSSARVTLRNSSPGRAIIRDMRAVAMTDEDWRRSRAALSPGGAGLPLSLAGGVVLDDEVVRHRETTASVRGVRETEFFTDRPGADDPLNLTAVTLAGSYAVPGVRPRPSAEPVCFLSPESLITSTWRTLEDAAPAEPAAHSSLPAAGPTLSIERIGPGVPLDYSYLFSLSTADRAAAGRRPVISPGGLLVSLTPEYATRPAAARAELKAAFERRGLEAAIEPWPPSTTETGFPTPPFAVVLALAAALLAVIAAANAALKPVLSAVLPEDEPGGGLGLSFWRPSFLARSFSIAFVSGTIGTLWGLTAIFLYNHLAPPALQEALTAVLNAGSAPLPVPWTGPAAAAAGVLLFTFLSLPGPRRRARRIVRLLSAEPDASNEYGRPTRP